MIAYLQKSDHTRNLVRCLQGNRFYTNRQSVMKKIMLIALAGLTVLGATLTGATSCDKVTNGEALTELWVLVAEGELLSADNYTTVSWTPFAAALSAAKRVAGSGNPSLQDINAVTTNLRNTMAGLVSRDLLRGKLQTAIAVSEAWQNDGYTEASWNSFQEALATAKKIYAASDARPDELDKVLNELLAAFDSLSKG